MFSRDIEGSQNYKNRSRDVGDAPCDLLLHFLVGRLTINLRTKFEVPSFTLSMNIEEVAKL